MSQNASPPMKPSPSKEGEDFTEPSTCESLGFYKNSESTMPSVSTIASVNSGLLYNSTDDLQQKEEGCFAKFRSRFTSTITAQERYELNEDQFWGYNMHHLAEPRWYHQIAMTFCPCCAGPQCSPIRKQDYLNMITTFCFWMSVVQLIVFIFLELIVGGFDPANSAYGPPKSVLIMFGAKSSYLIKQEGQWWRLICPLFLNTGVTHVMMTLPLQIMEGMGLEKKWGLGRVIFIYFLAGIGGYLFSCVVLPEGIYVGSLGAALGLIGAKISQIIVKWKKYKSTQARFVLCLKVCILLIVGFLSALHDFVDWSAQVGGLMLGFLIGFTCFAHELEAKWIRWLVFGLSVLCTVAYFVILGLVFAMVTHVTPIQ